MDDRGNIQRFLSEAEAKKLGFDTMLTDAEAKALARVPKPERHSALQALRAVGRRNRREEKKRLRGVSKRESRARKTP